MKPTVKPSGAGAARGNVVLGRVSTEELARGDSVNRQIELGRAFCSKELAQDTNGEIHEIREEGISGKTFNRAGIHTTLALAQEKKIRYVVVLDVARFGRNTKEGLQTLDQLLEFDVDVKVITLPWLDYRTNHGRKEWARQLSDAECERGVYRDKAIAGMWHRAQQGYWKGGIPPYGFLRDGKQLVQDNEPARIMHLVFQTFANTGSVMATLEYFTKNNLLPWPDSARSKSTKPPILTKHFIESALRNLVYPGYVPAPAQRNEQTKDYVPDLEYHGRPYFKGKHASIVDAALWKKVQDLLERAKARASKRSYHAGSDEYLLQGLLTCGSCGMKFTNGATGKPGGAKILRYVCRSYSTQGKSTSCQNRDLPHAATEMAVIRTLAGLAQHPELISLLSSGAGAAKARSAEVAREQIETLDKEQAKIRRKIDNGVNLVCENRDTALARKVTELVEKLTRRDAEMTAELATLNARIQEAKAALPSEHEIRQALGRFEELVAHLPRGRLKQLIRLLVDDIHATKILDRNDPLYADLASSSRLIRLKITLSSTGVQFVAQAPASTVASADSSPAPSRPLGVIPVVFEVRCCGHKGNAVHIIDPAVLGSKVVTFADGQSRASSVISTLDESHPVFRAHRARDMQNRGMLKKDIAQSFGFSAGYVSYLFRILKLEKTILDTLVDPQNQHLRAWFGINRLIALAAEKNKDRQVTAFEAQCRLVPMTSRLPATA